MVHVVLRIDLVLDFQLHQQYEIKFSVSVFLRGGLIYFYELTAKQYLKTKCMAYIKLLSSWLPHMRRESGGRGESGERRHYI